MARIKILHDHALVEKTGIKYTVIEDDGRKRYFDTSGDEITEEKRIK